MNSLIPFNKPYLTGKELSYIAQAHQNGFLAGDGPFTSRCQEWLCKSLDVQNALLTHSCTAALELCSLLIHLKVGDEVIMPSFTFVSTANAFVLRGATPVFIDIRSDTLNIDENLIEEAITARTKAIVVVHYAGVSCEMDAILNIAAKYSLYVIEDAAHAIYSRYKDRPLGSIGNLGTLSFHETKNIISGEGGALLVNDDNFIAPAEIYRQKGTDRSKFVRGEVSKYTWQDLGSSFLPSEITASFLYAQLESVKNITDARLAIWNYYHNGLNKLEIQGVLRRPIIPKECLHNGHMYYILLPDNINRSEIINFLKYKNIDTVFHYIPLDSSPGGVRFGKVVGKLNNTSRIARQILRLPFWIGISKAEQDRVINALEDGIKKQLLK